MPTYSQRSHPAVAAALQAGAVGVLKTDTLYGVVASTRHETAVERVYRLRDRDLAKPCIVLIAGGDQLLTSPPDAVAARLAVYWPGPVSIILPVADQVPAWLHRGTRSLAYRAPADSELCQLLRQTGPLIAPSANPAGQPPASSIAEARQYFGDMVDFYVDSGPVPADTPPSTLLRVHADDTIERLR